MAAKTRDPRRHRSSHALALSVDSGLRWARVVAASALALPRVTAISARNPERGFAALARWAGARLATLGVTVSLDDPHRGRYHRPPYLFVLLNQDSLLETFVLPVIMPVPIRMIVNIEFALMPGPGLALVFQGSRVIVRQWPAQARRQLDAAVEDMRRGHSYGISIEGGRSKDGRLLPFKKGPAVMAIAAQATIVPFVIHGMRECMPHGEWRVRPGKVEVHMCEMLPTRGLTYDDRDRVVAELRRIAKRELARGP